MAGNAWKYSHKLDDVLIHHEEGVDILPSNIELSAIEVSLVNVMSRELILRQLVERVRDAYDFIIIDCMPSLGMMTINALACADAVLIPVQAAYAYGELTKEVLNG